MALCSFQFILPKFLAIWVIFILIHGVIILAKKLAFSKKNRVTHAVLFILYTIVSYYLAFGINEFGVVNCFGD